MGLSVKIRIVVFIDFLLKNIYIYRKQRLLRCRLHPTGFVDLLKSGGEMASTEIMRPLVAYRVFSLTRKTSGNLKIIADDYNYAVAA